jgi:hypothetical protein
VGSIASGSSWSATARVPTGDGVVVMVLCWAGEDAAEVVGERELVIVPASGAGTDDGAGRRRGGGVGEVGFGEGEGAGKLVSS